MGADERVHAGTVRIDLFARVLRQTIPSRTRRAAESDGAQKSILRNCGLSKYLREPPVADAPLEFHLPEAVLSMHVAKTKKRIRFARCKDVRDRVGIAHDVDRSGKAADSQVAAHLWQ